MYGAPIADVHVHVHVHVLRKMFFRLVTSVGQKKILSPHEETNLRPSDLRSDALPLRLHGERGLLRNSYDTRPAYC